MSKYKICPTLSLRAIGSERYLFRSRDQVSWETEITKQSAFWSVWSLFSTPKNIDDVLEGVTDDERGITELAINGMLECGLLEEHGRTNGLDNILYTKLIKTQPESVSYHLSSARIKWINYSSARDTKEQDLDKMDEKIREETMPSNFKKAQNSKPAYDLSDTIPVEVFGEIMPASKCFGKSYIPKQNNLSLDHINFILNMSFAQTDEVNMYATGAHVRKPVPSGGARHPTEVYLLINHNVSDIEFGCYHYNVKSHRLDKINISERNVKKAMRAATLVPRARKKSPAVVFIHSCIFERSMYRYRESRSYRVMNFDLGHLHANEVIGTKLLGFDFSECYSVAEREIEAILSLDPLKESVMSSFIIHGGT